MRREPPDKTEPEPPADPKPAEEQPKPPRRFGIDDNPTDKKTDPWGGPPPR